MHKMASFVDNKAIGEFLLKNRGKDVFIKLMHVAEELERACTNNICKIQTKFFPLLREGKEDYDPRLVVLGK